MQDLALTISFLLIPGRFLSKFENGLSFYLLNESVFVVFVQRMSFIVLTVCLIRIPSMSLAVLFEEVHSAASASSVEMAELVTKWKRRWFLTCDLVEEINDFIGLPMLIFFINVLFTSASYSFIITYRLLINDHFSFPSNGIIVYVALKLVVFVVAMAFVSEKIPAQVSCLSKPVAMIDAY